MLNLKKKGEQKFFNHCAHHWKQKNYAKETQENHIKNVLQNAWKKTKKKNECQSFFFI